MEAVNIEIFGKAYQIKCPQSAVDALQKAASYLESKMRTVRDSGTVISLDRIAVITALNLAYQLLLQEHQNHHANQTLNQRLHDLQSKIETVLARNSQLELQATD